jgi:3'(2'), 5'-bisphosphate nucleotidase
VQTRSDERAAVDATDLELAVQLAGAAGEQLLRLRAARSSDGAVAALGADGDRAAQEILAAGLRAARPGDVVLSEEAADDPARLRAERVWIVDPLDGTREYGEGREDWAVHVALWDRTADDLIVGAVALPAQGVVLASDGTPAGARADGPPRVVVSRSRPPAEALAVAEALGGELVPMGSAGAKVAAVVLGTVDVYVHSGGQYQWDSAAPVAVARAAGLHTSRADGSPLRYNRAELSLPDLVVARPEYADAVLAAINGSY